MESSDYSDLETTVFDFMQYQPQNLPNYQQLFRCVLPPNIKSEFFEHQVQKYPLIVRQLQPRVLPGVPFEPLQITTNLDQLIPNRRVLTAQESTLAPEVLNSINSLQFEAYVPRFRLEDDENEDENLPNFAQSFRSRYDYSLLQEVNEVKNQIYKRETFDQGWRFSLFQAGIIQLKKLKISEDEQFWLNLLKEKQPLTRQKQLSEYVKTNASIIAKQLCKLVIKGGVEIENKIINYKFDIIIKDIQNDIKHHFKNLKEIAIQELSEEDAKMYIKYVKECFKYRTLLSSTQKPKIDQRLGDAIIQAEQIKFNQIQSQQQEIFMSQNQRNEALNYITEVYQVSKQENGSKRLHSECQRLEFDQLYSKHPNSQSDEYFYNRAPYPRQLPKIITSNVVDDITQHHLQQNKRLCQIFNRPVSQLQLTAFYHSQYHGFGLYSLKNYNSECQISEYCGEIINSTLSEIRDKEYLKNRFISIYMFSLRSDVVIDATFIGSYARFLNHSCTANAQSCSMYLQDNQLIPNNKSYGEPIGIGMYGIGAVGQEMTLDYNLQKVQYEKKMPCLCGSDNCTGHIN